MTGDKSVGSQLANAVLVDHLVNCRGFSRTPICW
jgi:hypothetical protein